MKIDKLSKNILKLGCLLTLFVITIIILTIILGIPGLIIATIIMILILYFPFKKKIDKK